MRIESIPRLCLLCVCLGLVAHPDAAGADELHYENFRYGQRAMGIGGASVAFPGEPEATYYNPAALALVEGAILSGSLQFFGTESRRLKDGFRATGPDHRTLRNPVVQDLETSDFLALPSSSVVSKSFDNHVLAFSTFLVSRGDEKFSDAVTQGSRMEQTLLFNRRDTDQIVYMGPTYAWTSANRGYALGLSVFYARRDQRAEASNSFTEDLFNAQGQMLRSVFDDTEASTDISDGALLARMGALMKMGNFRIGFTATTESVSLHGEGRFSYTFTDSGDPQDPSDSPPNQQPFRLVIDKDGLDARTTYPWNFAVGAAYELPSRLTVAAQISAYMPTTYDRVDLSAQDNQLIKNHLVNRVERQLVINGAAGMEWFATPSIPVRLGVFTNRSAAPDVPAWSNAIEAPQVHLFGSTVSLGYIGEDRSINIGGEVQWGSGDDMVLRDVTRIWNPSFVRVEREQWRAVLFLSGAIDFVEKTATEIMGDDE